VPPTSASTATTGLPVFGPSDAYHPTIDPARFSPNIDNPWLPFPVGTTFTYEGTRDDKPARVTVHVTSETTIIAGVTCRVVTDQLIQDGKLAEDTRDYYTQDDAGNVWYFGEDTQSLDRAGKVTSTEGTWHAGIDGAQPGVVMPADPHVGDHYRQEFYKGQAEDEFKIVSLDDPVTVPAATYPAAIRTEETSVLEPDVVDNKYYARGIGVVKEIAVKGPNEKLELVDVTTT
jgi:hypothetical protein